MLRRHRIDELALKSNFIDGDRIYEIKQLKGNITLQAI